MGCISVNKDLYDEIKSCGGQWNDTKKRPVVCCIKSTEHPDLYWAIPVGNFNHRDNVAKNRINYYLSLPENDIRSCYYHVARTTTKSIFFISDVIPVTDAYIEREYLGYDSKMYVIKNKNVQMELEKKLKRILSFENSSPDSFRQKITSTKKNILKI